MCEPLSLTLLATAGSLAATGAGMYTQHQAMKKQEEADSNWTQFQAQARRAEEARQEKFRMEAEGARQRGLKQIDPIKQATEQGREATRLETELAQGTTGDVNVANVDTLLQPGQERGDEHFKDDAAARISQASKEARNRIKALAAVQSFGESPGSLSMRNEEMLNRGNQGIKMVNSMRQGSLGAFGATTAIEPLQYSVSDPYSGIGTALAGIAGKGWGNYFNPANMKA